MNKVEIRKINKELRNNMSEYDVKEKSKRACEIFLNSFLYKNSDTVMIYYPLGNETDTSFIMEKILQDKKTGVLPYTDINTNEIIPIEFNETTTFKKGAFGILEPNDMTKMSKRNIKIAIIPGIAFDKIGQRVGFGKGYYDRFLKDTDIIKVGFCYDFQVVDRIIADPFDIKMDYLITESEMKSFCE